MVHKMSSATEFTKKENITEAKTQTVKAPKFKGKHPVDGSEKRVSAKSEQHLKNTEKEKINAKKKTPTLKKSDGGARSVVEGRAGKKTYKGGAI